MKKPAGGVPGRRAGSRPARPVIRVLTEGKVTEPEYLTCLARAHREITVSFDRAHTGSDPLTLVREAKRQLARSRSRSRADGPDFDEIWCVFDTDEHLALPAAIAEADTAGVALAISNPCFELWLVLHVEVQTAWIHRHAVQHRAEALGLTSGKTLCDADRVCTMVDHAVARAQRLDDGHAKNDSPSGANPSSGVWRLVHSMRVTAQDYRDALHKADLAGVLLPSTDAVVPATPWDPELQVVFVHERRVVHEERLARRTARMMVRMRRLPDRCREGQRCRPTPLWSVHIWLSRPPNLQHTSGIAVYPTWNSEAGRSMPVVSMS